MGVAVDVGVAVAVGVGVAVGVACGGGDGAPGSGADRYGVKTIRSRLASLKKSWTCAKISELKVVPQ